MDAEAWMRTIIDILLILIGTPGNLLIILVYGTKGIRISAHVFIIGLAMADIFVCFTRPLGVFNNIPRLEKYKHSSEILCRLPYFLKFVAMFSSVVITSGIAVDRYFAVCKPHGHIMSVHRAKLAVGFCFTLCLILSIPPLVVFGLVEYPHYGVVCAFVTPEWTTSFLVTPVYIVGSASLMIIIILYIRIYIAVRHRIKVRAEGLMIDRRPAASSTRDEEGSTGNGTRVTTVSIVGAAANNPDQQATVRSQPSKVKSKTTKMLFITTVVFVITWIPFMATINFSPETKAALYRASPAGYVVVIFLSKLLLINHAVNPFIYGIVSQRFREDAKHIWQKLKRWITKQ
ncbi:alpha-1A adrenergic receptor-like [Amphiura filiformis]|uniref:alpha-1A adrenergic receptor-like n=1 Tax=Amphiura filiformis TaxID=82378 RepID=UPI003B226A6B